jgi:hypothetical protein
VANRPALAFLPIRISIHEKMTFDDASIWLFFLFAMRRHVRISPEHGRLSAAGQARPA